MRTAIAIAAVLSAVAACDANPAGEEPVEASAVAEVESAVLEADAVDAAAGSTDATDLAYAGDDDSAVTATVTGDESYRITEDGRTYYYRRGEENPYLVREQGRTYAFSGGRLESAVDAQGRALPQADRQRVERDAAERGRELKAGVSAPDDRTTASPAPVRTTETAQDGPRRTGTDGKWDTPDTAAPRRDGADQSEPRGTPETDPATAPRR